jgi:hypothetical protein
MKLSPINQVRLCYGSIIIILVVIITFMIAELEWRQTVIDSLRIMIGNLARRGEV